MIKNITDVIKCTRLSNKLMLGESSKYAILIMKVAIQEKVILLYQNGLSCSSILYEKLILILETA
jgi:hypothetical protein